jgi:uncharacterized protein (DUF983 family)
MTAIGVDTAPSRSGVLSALYDWPLRRWVAAVVAAVVIAVFVGVPTGLVPTPIYHRMTPTTWWDYAVWAASATVAGLTLATYVRGSAVRSGQTREKFAERSLAATIVSGLAVGCPICNKVVVALVGISGALNYWAPLQPVIGVLSVALLSAGLFIRLRGEIACPVPGS